MDGRKGVGFDTGSYISGSIGSVGPTSPTTRRDDRTRSGDRSSQSGGRSKSTQEGSYDPQKTRSKLTSTHVTSSSGVVGSLEECPTVWEERTSWGNWTLEIDVLTTTSSEPSVDGPPSTDRVP